MDLTVDKYAQRYDRMREIATERKRDRDTYGPESKCCDDPRDIKMIVAHGYWDDEVDHFSLGDGYKVIMLCQPGKKISLSKRKLDELREIYLNGSSFFKNNDTDPEDLTSEARSWFSGVNCPCQARLYLGGVHDIGGQMVQTQVPNISLEFGGSRVYMGHCDNWSGEVNPTKLASTECKITCIQPRTETSAGQLTFCDKYYFDADSSAKDPDSRYRSFTPYLDQKPSIALVDLIAQEGPGTYLVVSCMATHREELPPRSLARANLMSRMHLSQKTPIYDEDEPRGRRWLYGKPMWTKSQSRAVADTALDLKRQYTLRRQKETRNRRLSTLRNRGGKKLHKNKKHKQTKCKTRKYKSR